MAGTDEENEEDHGLGHQLNSVGAKLSLCPGVFPRLGVALLGDLLLHIGRSGDYAESPLNIPAGLGYPRPDGVFGCCGTECRRPSRLGTLSGQTLMRRDPQIEPPGTAGRSTSS